MGLFNPYAPFLSDGNMLFQITILCVLVFSLLFKFRQSYSKHGATMGIAVALHTISIFAIMVPSLAAITGIFENVLSPLAIVILLHAVVGSLVELLGVYLTTAWALGHFGVEVCFRRKRVMDLTLILWLVELALGAYVYILLYVPI
jgi:hypothetical protein